MEFNDGDIVTINGICFSLRAEPSANGRQYFHMDTQGCGPVDTEQLLNARPALCAAREAEI